MTVYSFITIDDPFATNGTFAFGIDGKGQIVGTYRDSGGNHGFVDIGIGGATLNDPSTIPRRAPAPPRHSASTTMARSSGLTLTTAPSPPASSSTAGPHTPPTNPFAPTDPVPAASTTAGQIAGRT